jgi:general secretion pathway protein L
MISQLHLGSSIGAAWNWWLGELGALVPTGLRRWFGGMHGRHVLLVDASGGALVYETGGRREMLGRIDGPAGVNLGASRRARGRPTVIRLQAESGLRTTLTLPLAAVANLTQVVGFEIERQTPFKPDDIYFAHRIATRDAKAKSLLVELTVAPRAVVDEALRLAETQGLRVAGVEVAGAGGSLVPSPNLLPERQRAAGQGPFRVILVLLVVATLGLAAAAAAIPLLRTQAAVTDLTQRVAEAKHRAEAGLKLQKDIEETRQDAQFLVARKRQTPSVSELLATLTRLMPDDTWLSELQITASEVQLSGYAVSATALLSLLDETAGFSNAAFRSSVTQDSKLNREQFDIVAKIKARPK